MQVPGSNNAGPLRWKCRSWMWYFVAEIDVGRKRNTFREKVSKRHNVSEIFISECTLSLRIPQNYIKITSSLLQDYLKTTSRVLQTLIQRLLHNQSKCYFNNFWSQYQNHFKPLFKEFFRIIQIWVQDFLKAIYINTTSCVYQRVLWRVIQRLLADWIKTNQRILKTTIRLITN